jgi:hemerythrin superfamily protein
MTKTEENDVVELLRQQHRAIRTLIRQVAAAKSAARRKPFVTLVRLLVIHETAEQEVVYPVVRDSGETTAPLMGARVAEQVDALKALRALEKMDCASDDFTQAFGSFTAEVDRHLCAEEADVFPILTKMQGAERHRLAAGVIAAEMAAPTHPHRFLPSSTVGNLFAGPFVGMADRLRDVIKDARKSAK